MDHRIPVVGGVLAVIAAIVSLVTFIYLNEAFKGPSVTSVVSHPYELKATFDDVENLPTKTSVLSRGVSVGSVDKVEFDKASGSEPASGTVTFTVDDEYAPVYKDAKARIGERTILGDAFLDLDLGHEAAGELETGSEVSPVPSIDFDEALDFLDEEGRAHLRSTLNTVGEGASTEGNGARLNGTIGGVSRTVDQLTLLTRALQGQEQDIADLTSSASTVLGELGNRERALRTIVGSGRQTLDALASNTASVEQGVHELPGLLESGRSSLAGSEPLFREARPLVRDLRKLAPDLSPALARIGPVSRDAARLIEGLGPFRKAATPWLQETKELLILADPVVKRLEPAVRNLVPLLEYLAPRSTGVASFFTGLSSAIAHGDSRGRWLRFSTNVVPGELLGGSGVSPSCGTGADPPATVCENPYPAAGDALNPQPFKHGDYTRVMPWEVPPRP